MQHTPMWAWAVTVGIIIALLVIDFVAVDSHPHRVKFREAVGWSVFYIAVALAFGAVLGLLAGGDLAGQYFAGYLVEKSLSVDNLFVFVIIMAQFAVPAEHQHKVLLFGITIALVLRAVFIALGAALLAVFVDVFLLFGLLLLWTAVQLVRHHDQDPDIDDNAVVRLARRLLPVSPEYDGGRLTTHPDGRRMVTPLLLVLVAIGTTDLLFALDSIPAVFGVTDDAFIVFAANAFALLGLRALFFLVQGLLDRLVYLSYGLAAILAFIGVKLVLHWFHERFHHGPEISTWLSLVVIAVILTVTVVASLAAVRRDPSRRAHAGRLRDRSEQPVAPVDAQ